MGTLGGPQQIPLNTVGTAIWMGVQNAPPVLVYNQDANNNVSVNYLTTVTPNSLNAIPLVPGSSVVMDGTKTIYAAAPAGTAPVVVIPGATSFFQRPKLAAIGGAAVFFQASAPPTTSPPNSLWFTPTGNLFQLIGGVWTQVQFNATSVIEAGTIISSLIAAGQIYAGIVNGTEIDGALLRVKNSFGATIMTINKSSGTWLLYLDLGSATQGALIASGAAKAGTDEFGNTFFSGLNTYVPVSSRTFAVSLNLPSGAGFAGVSVQDLASAPSQVPGFFAQGNGTTTALAFVTSGASTGADVASFIQAYSQVQSSVGGGQIVLQAGLVQIDTGGNLADHSVDGNGIPRVRCTTGDGVTYGYAQHSIAPAASIPINSTAPINIFNISVGALQYRIRMKIIAVGNQAAGTPIIGYGGGTATVQNGGGDGWYKTPTGGYSNGFIYNGANFGTNVGGPTLALNGLIAYEADLIVKFSAAGTFIVRGQEGTSGDSWTVSTNSSIDFWPI